MTPAPVFDSPLYPKPHPVGEPKRTPARAGLPASLDRILWVARRTPARAGLPASLDRILWVARRTPARPGLPSGLRQRDTRGWVGSCQGTRYLSRPGRQVSVGYEFRRIWLPGGGCGGKFRRFRVRGVGIAPGVPVFSWFSHALCQGIPVLINGHALPWLFRHAQNHRENCTEGGESGIIKDCTNVAAPPSLRGCGSSEQAPPQCFPACGKTCSKVYLQGESQKWQYVFV